MKRIYKATLYIFFGISFCLIYFKPWYKGLFIGGTACFIGLTRAIVMEWYKNKKNDKN